MRPAATVYKSAFARELLVDAQTNFEVKFFKNLNIFFGHSWRSFMPIFNGNKQSLRKIEWIVGLKIIGFALIVFLNVCQNLIYWGFACIS